MTNRNFDILDAKIELQNAKQSVAAYGIALVRTDIEDAAVEFLGRAFRGAKEWQANQQAWLDRGAF